MNKCSRHEQLRIGLLSHFTEGIVYQITLADMNVREYLKFRLMSKKERQCLIEKCNLPEDVIICTHLGKLVKVKQRERFINESIYINI